MPRASRSPWPGTYLPVHNLKIAASQNDHPMPTLAEKGLSFRALHQRDHAFIIPNPWDVGSARILAHLGFEALATTSMGYAFSNGQRDNTLTRDQAITHCRTI